MDIKEEIRTQMKGFSFTQKYGIYRAYMLLMIIVNDPFARENLDQTRRVIEESMDMWERLDETTKQAIREEIAL